MLDLSAWAPDNGPHRGNVAIEDELGVVCTATPGEARAFAQQLLEAARRADSKKEEA